MILGHKPNYVYYNYVLKNPKYFTFIVQDMFMINHL